MFIGVGDWSGLEQTSFTLPTLPEYPTVRIVDILWCFPVAAGVAAAAAAVIAMPFFAAGSAPPPAKRRLP